MSRRPHIHSLQTAIAAHSGPLDIGRFARQGLGMFALLLHMHEGVDIKDAFIDTDRARYDRPHFTA